MQVAFNTILLRKLIQPQNEIKLPNCHVCQVFGSKWQTCKLSYTVFFSENYWNAINIFNKLACCLLVLYEHFILKCYILYYQSLPRFCFIKTQVNTKHSPILKGLNNTQTFLLHCQNESGLIQSTHSQIKVQCKFTFHSNFVFDIIIKAP